MKRLLFITVFSFSLFGLTTGYANNFNMPQAKYKTKGYKGFVDIGYTVGTGEHIVNRFQLETSHGFQLNSSLFLGLGTGIHIYHDYEYNNPYYELNEVDTHIPVFLDFRANFTKTRITPFTSIKVGYLFGPVEDFQTIGLYVSPSVGVKYRFNYSLALNISIGYTVQLVDEIINTKNYGGPSFRIGFEF